MLGFAADIITPAHYQENLARFTFLARQGPDNEFKIWALDLPVLDYYIGNSSDQNICCYLELF